MPPPSLLQRIRESRMVKALNPTRSKRSSMLGVEDSGISFISSNIDKSPSQNQTPVRRLIQQLKSQTPSPIAKLLGLATQKQAKKSKIPLPVGGKAGIPSDGPPATPTPDARNIKNDRPRNHRPTNVRPSGLPRPATCRRTVAWSEAPVLKCPLAKAPKTYPKAAVPATVVRRTPVLKAPITKVTGETAPPSKARIAKGPWLEGRTPKAAVSDAPVVKALVSKARAPEETELKVSTGQGLPHEARILKDSDPKVLIPQTPISNLIVPKPLAPETLVPTVPSPKTSRPKSTVPKTPALKTLLPKPLAPTTTVLRTLKSNQPVPKLSIPKTEVLQEPQSAPVLNSPILKNPFLKAPISGQTTKTRLLPTYLPKPLLDREHFPVATGSPRPPEAQILPSAPAHTEILGEVFQGGLRDGQELIFTLPQVEKIADVEWPPVGVFGGNDVAEAYDGIAPCDNVTSPARDRRSGDAVVESPHTPVSANIGHALVQTEIITKIVIPPAAAFDGGNQAEERERLSAKDKYAQIKSLDFEDWLDITESDIDTAEESLLLSFEPVTSTAISEYVGTRPSLPHLLHLLGDRNCYLFGKGCEDSSGESSHGSEDLSQARQNLASEAHFCVSEGLFAPQAKDIGIAYEKLISRIPPAPKTIRKYRNPVKDKGTKAVRNLTAQFVALSQIPPQLLHPTSKIPVSTSPIRRPIGIADVTCPEFGRGETASQEDLFDDDDFFSDEDFDTFEVCPEEEIDDETEDNHWPNANFLTHSPLSLPPPTPETPNTYARRLAAELNREHNNGPRTRGQWMRILSARAADSPLRQRQPSHIRFGSPRVRLFRKSNPPVDDGCDSDEEDTCDISNTIMDLEKNDAPTDSPRVAESPKSPNAMNSAKTPLRRYTQNPQDEWMFDITQSGQSSPAISDAFSFYSSHSSNADQPPESPTQHMRRSAEHSSCLEDCILFGCNAGKELQIDLNESDNIEDDDSIEGDSISGLTFLDNDSVSSFGEDLDANLSARTGDITHHSDDSIVFPWTGRSSITKETSEKITPRPITINGTVLAATALGTSHSISKLNIYNHIPALQRLVDKTAPPQEQTSRPQVDYVGRARARSTRSQRTSPMGHLPNLSDHALRSSRALRRVVALRHRKLCDDAEKGTWVCLNCLLKTLAIPEETDRRSLFG